MEINQEKKNKETILKLDNKLAQLKKRCLDGTGTTSDYAVLAQLYLK